MNNSRLHTTVAPIGLVAGAALGLAGSFVPTAALRGLAWGLDGTALVLATAILTIHHFRRGNDLLAAGFLVFVAGQILVVSGSAMDLAASAPSFAAGAALWAASLFVISSSNFMPAWTRASGSIAALLFTIVAIQVFSGRGLTPLSHPLPFFAYPFLVATLLGWAWTHFREKA